MNLKSKAISEIRSTIKTLIPHPECVDRIEGLQVLLGELEGDQGCKGVPTEQVIKNASKAHYMQYDGEYDSIAVADKAYREAAQWAISQMQPEWVDANKLPPGYGVEVLGFHPSWIDEDVNPDGICVCYFQDEEKPYWIISKYCNNHDEWHTRYSHDAKHSLGDKFGGHYYIDSPSLWMFKPQPPTK